ncbi:hypothetical protein OXX80_004585, partial [Metschnikowia pulcherrima]
QRQPQQAMPAFPSVAQGTPQDEDEDEEALRALQAEMGL